MSDLPYYTIKVCFFTKRQTGSRKQSAIPPDNRAPAPHQPRLSPPRGDWVTAIFSNLDRRKQVSDFAPHLHCREASIAPSPCRRRGTASAVDEVSKGTNARFYTSRSRRINPANAPNRALLSAAFISTYQRYQKHWSSREYRHCERLRFSHGWYRRRRQHRSRHV